jgi:hypothetical protein
MRADGRKIDPALGSPVMRRRLLFLLAIGIVLAIACDRSPAPQTPTPVQAATLLELSMNGARLSVAVGDSPQAFATLTDGSVSDVTSRARWESSDAAVASVSPTGFVSFKQAGDVRISVTLQNQTDAWIVRVQNPA